jgi:hypothetical protein
MLSTYAYIYVRFLRFTVTIQVYFSGQYCGPCGKALDYGNGEQTQEDTSSSSVTIRASRLSDDHSKIVEPIKDKGEHRHEFSSLNFPSGSSYYF